MESCFESIGNGFSFVEHEYVWDHNIFHLLLKHILKENACISWWSTQLPQCHDGVLIRFYYSHWLSLSVNIEQNHYVLKNRSGKINNYKRNTKQISHKSYNHFKHDLKGIVLKLFEFITHSAFIVVRNTLLTYKNYPNPMEK